MWNYSVLKAGSHILHPPQFLPIWRHIIPTSWSRSYQESYPASQQKSLVGCLSNLKMQDATKMYLISFKRMLFALNIIVKEAGMPSIMICNAALTRPSEVKKNSHVKTRRKGGCWIWIKHSLAYISERIGSIRARTHVKANDLQWPCVTKIQQLLYCKWITVDYEIYKLCRLLSDKWYIKYITAYICDKMKSVFIIAIAIMTETIAKQMLIQRSMQSLAKKELKAKSSSAWFKKITDLLIAHKLKGLIASSGW